jgi:UDP-N-acetylmuramyl pentapeptide phosphotransferase/UDP-N-acetylglucosamine-1-phosphate transferase
MDYLPAIFSLLVGAAGWYYMFYSKAAQRLESVEGQRQNRLRVRLRRVGGLSILLLAVAFYALFSLPDDRVRTAMLLMAAVVILMMVILILGLIDLRLTRRLRRERNKWQP